MFNADKSRALLAVTDLLGWLALAFGLVFAVYGFLNGFKLEAVYSIALAAAGLGLLVMTYLGRALIHLAETNSAILAKLNER